MSTARVAKLMQTQWDRRAAHDPFFYVETAFWTGDVAEFFELGETRTRALIDPVCEAHGIYRRLGARAVDVGCGVGRFSRALAARFAHVDAVDVSVGMVREAIKLHTAPCFLNLRFLPTDGVSMPVADASIDFAWCYQVIQHLPTRAVQLTILREVRRVLKPDGVALLHFRTAYDRAPVLHHVARFAPTWSIALAKRAVGKDHRTADAAFRGAPPTSQEEILAMLAASELRLVEFRDDSTHATGSRVFADAARQ